MSEQAAAPDMTPGIFSWNELMTPDAAGSKEFYTQLFGWTSETMPMGPGMEYHFLKVGGRPAGGMFQLPPGMPGAQTGWMSYVTVPDVAAAVAKATGLGAKICKEITTIPMGRFAIIMDPQGAAVGLWEFAK